MIDQLILLGVSHQTAPLAVRERIARLAEDPRLSLDRLRDVPGVNEGMLLSTCNRVEIYGAGTPVERIADGFRTLLAQEPAVAPHLYELRGERVLRHLFRVASSLDSMIVGEPQILGQLKQAYRAADRSGAAGDTLHRAMGRAFAVAKRVRTETDVGRSSVSMVHAAVELTARVFDSLAGKRALVVGAGEMARLAAERLAAQKVAELRIANRTAANAEALVKRLSGGVPARALSLAELGEALRWADLVLTAATVERPLITRELLKPHLKARRFRTLLLVDISVPRCVEPELGAFENVYVKDVDDVGRLAAQNVGRRSDEARRAEEIVEAEVESFTRVLRGRAAVPVLNALRERGRQVAEEEAKRTLARIGGTLDATQRESVEAMANAIVNKLLHEPTAKLRAAAEAGEASVLADATGELFGLAGPEAVAQPPKSDPNDDSEKKG
jgi:glutamyl-tRNA reductase